MYARSDMPISFPGLFGDFEINPSPVAINIGHGIYWYGILICTGVILAVLFCAHKAKEFGLKGDNVYDMVIWEIPLSILGARLYYIIFYLDRYRLPEGGYDWAAMIRIWDGGLAIYGGVIVAFIVLYIFCKKKKISFGALADLCVMGLFIGQIIGRWGNFMNREAFGAETTLPWRMRLWTSATEFIEVHPTFLYESLWNLVGLAILVFYLSKRRTFDGENTCFYFMWYGLGRAWIEGLRTDSLYFFDVTLFGSPVRVSQVLSVILIIAAGTVLVIQKKRHPKTGEDLFVNRVAAMAKVAPSDSEMVADDAEPIVKSDKNADESDCSNQAE